MHTTLTLDDDLAALLEREAKKSGMTFEDAVNHFLRQGMKQPPQKTALKPFVVKSKPLGLPPGLSYDCIGQLLEDLEGPLHR